RRDRQGPDRRRAEVQHVNRPHALRAHAPKALPRERIGAAARSAEGSPMTRWLDHAEEGLIAFLLAIMTLITFGQVIARYVFNYSFVWALELVTFLFAWLIFLGMSYGVRVGSHIGVDALVKAFGPRVERVLSIIATLFCIAYALIALYGGWIYM